MPSGGSRMLECSFKDKDNGKQMKGGSARRKRIMLRFAVVEIDSFYDSDV
jgi:hypothetical protein